MNCWETLYMHILHQHKTLITERQIGDTNPLYKLAKTRRILPRNPQPVPHHVVYDAHLASCTPSSIFLHNMVSKLPHNPYSLIIFIYQKTTIYAFAHLAVLTIYLICIIYFTDMLPQHPVYKNELDSECSNITLARKNIAP